jgi:hypothetical protein
LVLKAEKIYYFDDEDGGNCGNPAFSYGVVSNYSLGNHLSLTID